MRSAWFCGFIWGKNVFDINGSTEFLRTYTRMFLANLFHNSLCKSLAKK